MSQSQSISLPGPLVLAGAGKMGGALLRGLFERGLAGGSVVIQEPSPSSEIEDLAHRHGARITANLTALDVAPAVILAAVKPQVMDAVFPAIARLAGPGTLTISIAAGKTVAAFERHLPARAAVVRAMPNTPAAIGRGITVSFANAHVSEAQRQLTDELLSAVGEVGWIDDETLMDAVTAVSGSGPAYVFLLAECLAQAGRAQGLDAALAERLANATVAGAGELLRRSGEDPATLRRNVTSPGGTTAAALEVLMAEDGLAQLMAKAVASATRRSRELS